MSVIRPLLLLTLLALTTGCKLTITVPEGGSVTTESGAYNCAEGSECTIDFVDAFFDERFVAAPAQGYEFTGWKNERGFFCGGKSEACAVSTLEFAGVDALMALLDLDIEFFLEPMFEEVAAYEILQVVSPTEIRAWISPEITRAEFDALELPGGWFKNQPREGGADFDRPIASRFARSPDATEDGDITIEELFGFNWFHAATVVETNLNLDDDGVLSGSRVRKYHELTYAAGSTLLLLVSPENEAYFRIGRDANRVSDEPTIPNLWQLVEYTTEEELVIQLFGGNVVIRTDNEDSFQGPIEIGEYTIQEDDSATITGGPLDLATDLCDNPENLDVLQDSPFFQLMRQQGSMRAEQIDRMLAEPTRGPFYMLNLIRYRDQAEYADGRETDLTGREANALYSPIEFLAAIGAAPVFVAEVGSQIDGDDLIWDDVAIVEYPCPVAFFAMVMTPDFQARAEHKDAGVEQTIVMVTHLQPSSVPEDFEWPESAYPGTKDDPAFELVHVMDFHDTAQYEAGADEPERTGAEAWQEYQSAGSDAALEVGARPTATLDIQGALIGDDRDWDQAEIIQMPSLAGFEALQDDATQQDASYHRLAALANNYSMITYPAINNLPGSENTDGNTGNLLPVTETGVGTICSTDADCVGIGFCVTDGNGPGFCSMNCGSGECGDSYSCCHSCSALAEALLPFSGSACMVNQAVGQLTAAPVSCTCD